MQNLLDTSEVFEMRKQRFGVHSHFEEGFVSGGKFTSLAADAGSAVASVSTGTGGTLTLTTGGTDNNEAAIFTTNNVFLFAANKPIAFATRIKYTEANTDDANVAVGLMNAVGANALVDDGAGPKASFSGIIFYKVDGETTWRAVASIGTTRTGPKGSTSNILLDANGSLDGLTKTPGGGSYQWLEINVVPFSTTKARADLFIDGVQVQSIEFTYTSAVNMMAFVYVKAGGANSEVVTVDFLGAEQKF